MAITFEHGQTRELLLEGSTTPEEKELGKSQEAGIGEKKEKICVLGTAWILVFLTYLVVV